MRKALALLLAGLMAGLMAAEKKKEGKVLRFHEYEVVTAEKIPLSILDVAPTVYSLSSEELRERDVKSGREVLNYIPSLYVPNYNCYGEAAGVFLRGSSSDRSLFLLNDLPLNSSGFYLFPFEALPASFLKKVEVVEGPQSILWGSDALGGVVNFMLDDEPDKQEVFLSTGTYSTLEGSAKLGFRTGRLAVKGGYYYYSTDGLVENDDYTSNSFYLTAVSRIAGSWKAELLFLRLGQNYSIPFLRRNVPARDRKADTSFFLTSLALEGDIAGLHLRLIPYFALQSLNFSDPHDPWGLTYSRTRSRSGGVRAEVLWSASPRLWFLVGAEGRREEVHSENNFGVQLNWEPLSDLALYTNLILQPSSSLTLSGGLRFHSSSRFGSRLLPKLALNWWPVEEKIRLRLSYGEGYRLPKALEFAGYWGNPELLPERSRGVEAGFDLFPLVSLRLSLSSFYTRYQDLIEYDLLTWKFTNRGKAEVRGIQAATTLQWRGHSIALHLVRLWSEDLTSGERLLRRPDWLAKADVQVCLMPEARLYLQLLYVGKRLDVDDYLFTKVENSGYFLINAAVNIKIYRDLELVLKGHNLLDVSYQDIYGYPSPGRNLYAGLRIGF